MTHPQTTVETCPRCRATNSVPLAAGDRLCLGCRNEWNPRDTPTPAPDDTATDDAVARVGPFITPVVITTTHIQTGARAVERNSFITAEPHTVDDALQYVEENALASLDGDPDDEYRIVAVLADDYDTVPDVQTDTPDIATIDADQWNGEFRRYTETGERVEISAYPASDVDVLVRRADGSTFVALWDHIDDDDVPDNIIDADDDRDERARRARDLDAADALAREAGMTGLKEAFADDVPDNVTPIDEFAQIIAEARTKYVGRRVQVGPDETLGTITAISDMGTSTIELDGGGFAELLPDEYDLIAEPASEGEPSDEIVAAIGSTTLTVAALVLRAGAETMAGANDDTPIGVPPIGWLPDDGDVLPIVEQGAAYAVAMLIHAYGIPAEHIDAMAELLTHDAQASAPETES